MCFGRLLLAALLPTLAVGCTNMRLRREVIAQAETLTDLHYAQVLGNLAMFADNPSAIPWHVRMVDATAQVTDSGTAGFGLNAGGPNSSAPRVGGSRTVVEQWGMSPVTQEITLRYLRVAYRRASGSPEDVPVDLLVALAHDLKRQAPDNPDLRLESQLFFDFEHHETRNFPEFNRETVTTNDRVPIPQGRSQDEGEDVEGLPKALPDVAYSPLARDITRQVEEVRDEIRRITPGWYAVGSKKDVPRDAVYVGRYRDRYAWVCRSGLPALSEFTLTVMKLTTIVNEPQTQINTGSGQVKFSPGDN